MAELPELSADLSEGPKPNAKYDIFPSMAPFLDPHMIFPVLNFLEELNIHDRTDIAVNKYEVARHTMMGEYIAQCYQEVHGEDAVIPKEVEERKAASEAAWIQTREAIEPFAEFFDTSSGAQTELMNELTRDSLFNPEYLGKNHGITAENIEALYRCAKLRYECSEYDVAAVFLAYYRELVPVESPKSLRALWGKLAADILSQQWDEAEKDRDALKELITKGAFAFTELETLQHRSWLLHWSLFVFANVKQGKEALVEFYLSDFFLNAIQLNCPWLLRYLATSILTSRKRHAHTKLLLKVIAHERATFRDPILEFMEALLLNFDFDGAQHKLAECESIIVTDYFLSSLTTPAEFMDSARRFIFETYCRIHEKIGLDTLSSKLHMSEEDAERWLVDLMRTASLDARIDSSERQIVMSVPATSVYQQIVEKTRDLATRTRNLADGIESAVEEANNNTEKPGAPAQRHGGYKPDYDSRNRGAPRAAYGAAR